MKDKADQYILKLSELSQRIENIKDVKQEDYDLLIEQLTEILNNAVDLPEEHRENLR